MVEALPPSGPGAGSGDHEGGTPRHVMVVDDDPAVRSLLRKVLERAGLRVTALPGGKAALEACRADPPQALLTDLAMEPMSGRALIEALKEDCPSTVPVVLTGHGSIDRTVDLMRVGAFDVLTKPCRNEEIVAVVGKAIEHHVALQANLDLRERLRVQEKLAMIGKLAAGVAHELNNPLDAVLRCVRLTRDRVNGDAEAREYLEIAETGLQRMADIVQSLLTFSRHARVEHTPQALLDLLEETASQVALAVGDDPPRIVLDVHPALARLPVPRGLSQIVANLLRNAYDAAGSALPVEVHARREEGRLVVEVRDHGPGIPAEIRSRVFEPFFTTKAPGKGTGLGLPLSARMAERFGGGLHLDCPRDGGTSVFVWLPLPGHHAAPAPPPAPPSVRPPRGEP